MQIKCKYEATNQSRMSVPLLDSASIATYAETAVPVLQIMDRVNSKW
jgi:hypothetical protein